MKIPKLVLTFCTFFIFLFCNAQTKNINSATRKFIETADITQIDRDFKLTAEFVSGIREYVIFTPILVTDLKSNETVKSLQVDMAITSDVNKCNKVFYKSSWIDISEVDEFITFLETYVVPNLTTKTDDSKSTSYVFNSKELTFNFQIRGNARKISVYLKDDGITDYEHYFWTQSQVNKIPDLLKVLKKIK